MIKKCTLMADIFYTPYISLLICDRPFWAKDVTSQEKIISAIYFLFYLNKGFLLAAPPNQYMPARSALIRMLQWWYLQRFQARARGGPLLNKSWNLWLQGNLVVTLRAPEELFTRKSIKNKKLKSYILCKNLFTSKEQLHFC